MAHSSAITDMKSEYHKNPKTCLMVTTRIPRIIKDNKMYTHSRLVIDIVSHMDHMKINSDRTSERKFGFFGQLDLVENNEGYFTKDWVFRHMEFETLDFNKALCDLRPKNFSANMGMKCRIIRS